MLKKVKYLCLIQICLIVNIVAVEIVDHEEKNCSLRDAFHCADGSGCISSAQYCDGKHHCRDGSDEEFYSKDQPADKDGISCLKLSEDYELRTCFLPSQYVGDRKLDCTLGEDECSHNHTFICKWAPPQVTEQCILRNQFCDGIRDCIDDSDEAPFKPGDHGMNCAVTKIQGTFKCGLPNKYMCDGIPDCNYEADECFCDPETGRPNPNGYSNGLCFRCLDGSSVISRNFLCDGTFHCRDLSDECLCGEKLALCDQVCKDVTNCGECQPGEFMCKNSENFSQKCIALSQLCDQAFDCPLKEDEAHCEIRRSEIFECHDGSQYILKINQCNNYTDCSDGSDEVNCSTLFFECNKESVYYVNTIEKQHVYESVRPRYTTACDLVPLCEDFEDECNETLCGPNLPEYCNFTNGIYGFVCPISGITLYGAEICDGYPTCFPESPEKSADELFCPNRFYCADKGKFQLPIHVPESSRCNGISDCFDHSDEMNCNLTTHFYCYSGPVTYVPRSKVCDGIQDCSNWEDECQECSVSPFSSDAFLINSYLLQAVIWIIGLISVVGNVVVLCYNIRLVWQDRVDMSKISYNHRLLVINLAAADLILGVIYYFDLFLFLFSLIYLLNIGVTNQTYYGNYCQKDIQWRASNTCVAMGVLAVVSTECCIFLLITMASMRLLLVARPFHYGIKRRYIVFWIALAWTVSLTLALIPLDGSQMDYFVSQIWYKNHPFLTIANQAKARDLVSFMWSINATTNNNNTSNATIERDRSYTWQNIIETIRIINDTHSPSLYFGYYSAHGVCLPRLFPDPRQDRSWGFSLSIITFNFIAFIYMLIAYIAIYKISARQSKSAGRADVDLVVTNLQHKITRIIFTNFFCWIPICIMAFFSAAGYNLSSDTYAVSAIILLPINSAFNPLLYSDLPDLIWKKLIVPTELGKYISRRQLENISKRTTITRETGIDIAKQIPNTSMKTVSTPEPSQIETKL